MKKVRILRRTAQILFLISGISVSLNLLNSISLARVFNHLHIVPSLSKMADLNFSPYLLIFLGLILTTLLFGRLYCSFLCPVGFLQDIAVFLGRKLKIRPKPAPRLRYLRTFLLFLLFALIFLRLPLYLFADHYTNMMSIFAHKVNPLLSGAMRPFSPGLYRAMGFYFPRIEFQIHGSLFYALFFFLAVFISSMFFPRIFCNTVCPSGLLFSFLSRHSLLKIGRRDSCRLCSKCDKSCPFMCMDNGTADKSQCIMCFECIGQCPFGSLSLHFGKDKKTPVKADDPVNGKRQFLKSAVYGTAGVFTGYALSKTVKTVDAENPDYIFPPGGDTYASFFSRCTSCGLCISSCPTKVLIPVRYQDSGIKRLLPAMDFNASYCSYDCNVCSGVCPMNALKYLDLEEKRITALGKAKIDADLCIPYRHNLDCGACAEHCPTIAIKMINLGTVLAPVVDRKFCIGCGICQYSCPLEGRKAINVEPLQNHERAYVRPRKGLESKELDDFPF